MGKFIPVEPEKWAEMVKAQAEVERLKAEVERLTNDCDYLDQKLDEELDKSAMLCGHVERLTKAGDAMAARLIYQGYPETVPAWNAAKEGKQP